MTALAARRGERWEYLAGDLPAWTKGAEWTESYPISTAEIALFGSSMKFDGSKLTSDTGLLSRTNLSPAISWAGGRRMGFMVYAHRLNPTCGIRLRVGLNASNYKYYTWATTENTLVEGWNFLVVHSQEDGALRLLQTGSSGPGWVVGAGAYDFETQPATYLALEVTGFRAPNYPILWVSSLFADGGEITPMITIGFDITNGFEPAKQVLDTYGFKGYLAVGAATEAERDRLVSLYNAGWDIVGHSASHNNLGAYSDREQIYTELNVVRNQLIALGMKRSANLFASPNGSWSNKSVYVLANSGFHWHRAVTNAPIAQYDCSFGHLNPLTQGAFTCGAATLDQLKARATLLLTKYKANCHFYSHVAEAGGNGSNWPADTNNIFTATLDGFCAYLKTLQDAGLCRVVTPSEYIATAGGGRGDPMDNFRVPNTVPLIVPASPSLLTNVTNKAVVFVVSGGTVSGIELSLDGSNYFATGLVAGMFPLEPGASIRITHTVPPTVTQIRHPAMA
jgi:hypothetical protein